MTASPTILIVTTCRWFSAARLAMAFVKNGCVVEAVCHPRHPLHLTTAVNRAYRFDPFEPEFCLRDAIEQGRPSLIVPCDDLAAIHLRKLAASLDSTAPAWLIDLLAASLGDPSTYSIINSRTEFLSLAAAEGIRTPANTEVHSEQQLLDWQREHGLPAVLKADGSSGGRGVKVVHTLLQAMAAFHSLSKPSSPLVALKRAFVDGDLNPASVLLDRSRPAISIQQFIPGRDFNIAVACWKGEVLASIGAEVVEKAYDNGPATRIRVAPDGEMLHAAQRISRRLNLTGIYGFDFMVEQATGLSYLIEINARATQTGHLPLGPNHDPCFALSYALSSAREIPASTARVSVASSQFNQEIALFPSVAAEATPWQKQSSVYHDIPWEEPALIRAGNAQTVSNPEANSPSSC